MEQRGVRIAAVGDVHYDTSRQGALRELFEEVRHNADVLALCGDLTTHGQPEQMKGFVEEMAGADMPTVAVLGNHDYEAGRAEECTRILCDAGVTVLDGTHVVLEGVGFAGTKGFAGGFGRGALGPFGEQLIKDFVSAALDESLKLEKALHMLPTESRVVLLHYSPIQETVEGEPEVIWPFLGSSRLVQPIDALGATLVLHGHAHHGTLEGITPGGAPVYNVAYPLLRQNEMHCRIITVGAPDRRAERQPDYDSGMRSAAR